MNGNYEYGKENWLRFWNNDLCGSDCLLIGGIYRSPSCNICNSTKSLCDLLQSVVGHSSHLLICGDFNYSDINWSDPLDPIPNTAHSQLFIDTFQDLFLYQHVVEPTRHSLSATPHTLDLYLLMKRIW